MNFEKARLSQAEADHEVQGDRKYRGKVWKRRPGVEHGSHQDEEARELDLSGYAGLVR